MNTGDYRESVEASQLSAENVAKAIIFKKNNKLEYDQFDELLEVASELLNKHKGFAEELVYLAHELAFEHDTIYGKLS